MALFVCSQEIWYGNERQGGWQGAREQSQWSKQQHQQSQYGFWDVPGLPELRTGQYSCFLWCSYLLFMFYFIAISSSSGSHRSNKNG